MNRERLHHLKKVMQNVEKRGDIVVMEEFGALVVGDEYISPEDVIKRDLEGVKLGDIRRLEKKASEHFGLDCGYAGCAIGWAALDKKFAEEGLSAEISVNGDMTPYFKATNGALYQGMEISDTFFGLTLKQGAYIFFSESYEDLGGREIYFYGDEVVNVTPADVIRHIDDVLSGNFDLLAGI